MKYISDVFTPPSIGSGGGVITDNGEIAIAKEISAEFNKLPAEEQARIYYAVFKKLPVWRRKHT